MPDGKLINGDKEYDMSSLSDDAKALVHSLKFTEAEMQRVEAMLAVLKTAHSRYSDDLTKRLDSEKKVN
jgi:hypothetical protein